MANCLRFLPNSLRSLKGILSAGKRIIPYVMLRTVAHHFQSSKPRINQKYQLSSLLKSKVCLFPFIHSTPFDSFFSFLFCVMIRATLEKTSTGKQEGISTSIQKSKVDGVSVSPLFLPVLVLDYFFLKVRKNKCV